MTTRLRQLLSKHMSEPPEIERCFVAKLGGMYFPGLPSAYAVAPKAPVESGGERDRSSDLPDFEEFSGRVHRALASHPNVFDLKQDSDAPQMLMMTHGGFLLGTALFDMRVRMPQKAQEELFSFANEGDAAEEFHAITNCTTLITLTKARDWPVYCHSAGVFREMLKRQLLDKAGIKIEAIGPTPIHPDIYCAVASKTATHVTTPRVFKEEQDLLILFPSAIASPLMIAHWILSRSEVQLERYYDLCRKRIELVELQDALLECCAALASHASAVRDLPVRALFTGSASVREGKAKAAEIHNLLLEHEGLLAEFLRARQALATELTQHPLFCHVVGYLVELIDDPMAMPSAFTGALAHFSDEIRSYQNARLLVATSLLSAGLASLITALIASRW